MYETDSTCIGWTRKTSAATRETPEDKYLQNSKYRSVVAAICSRICSRWYMNGVAPNKEYRRAK